MTSKENGKSDRLRNLVLSDLLRAELRGDPVEFEKYCAKYHKRIAILHELNSTRFVEVANNRWRLAFNGLAVLKSSEARRVLVDCQKVFKFMAKHYQANQREPVQVQNLADEIKRPAPRTALAVAFLNRGSNISFGTDSPTITPETKITGDLRLLEEGSFGKMVKKTREMLLRPSMAAARNLFPGAGQEEVNWLIDSVYSLGSEEVKAEWKKCIDRSNDDLTGSITAARSLVESACKQILDARGIQYPAASKLPTLYGFVRRELSLDPSGEADEALRTILQGCATAVNGLAELRNKHGDSHGKAPGSARPALRHARLAVAFAGAMTDFLLSTDDARKKP